LLASIVIINHNYGRFLCAAIESALDQDATAHEVIVVDDGSVDDSRSIIAAYGNRVRPVFKEAGGHVSAVNAGYAACNGEFVIFLDADDTLYRNCLTMVSRYWRPGIAKVQYRLDTIDGTGVDQRYAFPYFPSDLSPETVRTQSRRFGVYPWTVSSGNAFARSFLDRLLPIDAAVVYRSPDGYLSKMAPIFGDIVSLQEVLGAYRVHGNNTWAQSKTGFKVETVIRWLKFDMVLQAQFEKTAREQGVPVVAGSNTKSTQHLEYRFLAYRFAPAESPYPLDEALALVQAGVRAAWNAPNIGMAGRAIWCWWFLVLGFAPRPILHAILLKTRLQTGRSLLSRLLVRFARGTAR
jgi:hypothetical protein